VIVIAKATIGRLFWGSLIAFAGALILLATAGGLALANGSLVRDGPDVTGIRENAFGWVMACGVPEVCLACELQRWARVSRRAS